MEQTQRQLERWEVCLLFSLSTRGIPDAPVTTARIATEKHQFIFKIYAICGDASL